ncbi:nuclear transport factor 2 family protein [Undibacterium sp. CY18W]|uniref:Nuclear transport factor 2 family protein n=1 Tax=Undibacterium hunanense TaxID=2762292 RepID=A0ABR6ZP63_9BURK|nr:nuclear transport factor 2 family protein [Undibacterium hunanense]MBC3917686.1 nuclear transport factor 2 family protein [Undibacterium hunanense]
MTRIYPSPEVVVQRQLDAYNARDVDAIMKTYAAHAQQFEFPGKLLASGHAEIRARMVIRFQETNLHAKLVRREVIGNIVIDYEDIARTFPEGTGRIEMIAIYEVKEGLIQSASIAIGAKTLDS